MIRLFVRPQLSTWTSAALLVMRVVIGAAFVIHGWGKIQNPTTWMGPDAGTPGAFQALAAVAEFGGGAGLILGFLTPIACFGIACTMVVAIATHVSAGAPFVGKGSYELAAVYFSFAIFVLIAGPGRLAVDSFVFKRRA